MHKLQQNLYVVAGSHESEDAFIHLLGLTKKGLISAIGEPYASYSIRGREVLMFAADAGTVTCEMKDGFVLRVDSHEDRRTEARIKGWSENYVLLRHGAYKSTAKIEDLSVKSLAIVVPEGSLPGKDEILTFCAVLRSRARTLEVINLVATVHRVIKEERKIILLLHSSYETHSHRAFVDYVNSHLALAAIGESRVDPLPFDEIEGEFHIVRSDVCLVCNDKACEIDRFLSQLTSNPDNADTQNG